MSLNGNFKFIGKFLKLLLGKLDLFLRFLTLGIKFAAFNTCDWGVFLIFVLMLELNDLEVTMLRVEKQIFSANTLDVNDHPRFHSDHLLISKAYIIILILIFFVLFLLLLGPDKLWIIVSNG